MITLMNTLNSLVPDAKCIVRGNKDIEWLDERPQPTEAEIQAEAQRLQAEHDANQYQRDRAAEYPSMEDQLDDIFHNGIEGWKTTIQAVKTKYPKA